MNIKHKNLITILNNIPFMINDTYWTYDFVEINVKFIMNHPNHYNIDKSSDEYLITMSSPTNRVPAQFRVYVPLDSNGQTNRREYNNMVLEIYPAILEEYNRYKDENPIKN